MKPLSPRSPENREPGFTFGDLRLEPDGTLWRGDTAIHLPPKELAALRLLLGHAGQVVTPAELKQALWGDTHVTDDSVPRCLSSLRARLEPTPSIQTLYKRGYRLSGPVQRDDAQGHSAALTRVAIAPFGCGRDVPETIGRAIAEDAAARLTTALSASIAILARDSVFNLADAGLTALEIGRRLEADQVLTGSITAFAAQYRLRAEMVRIRDGAQIWVEDLLVDREHASGLELRLSQHLAFRLGTGPFYPVNPLETSSPDPADPDAYQLFLRGHDEWQKPERSRMQEGMQFLIRATEMSPGLLAAQRELVNASLAQSIYGFLPPRDAAERVRRIAEAVPNLSGNVSSSLPALGWISFHVDRDLASAVELFDRSAQQPHDPWTTRMRVMFALSRNRFDEAAQLLERAIRLDPFAPWLQAHLAWTHHLAQRADESVRQIERCMNLFPDHEVSMLFGGIIHAFSGDRARAVELAHKLTERYPYFDLAAEVEAYALARAGQHGPAREILEHLRWISRERFVLTSFTPAAYLELGETAEAIADLETSDEVRSPWFFQTLADPRLQSLAGNPEFERLRGILGSMEKTALELSEAAEDVPEL